MDNLEKRVSLLSRHTYVWSCPVSIVAPGSMDIWGWLSRTEQARYERYIQSADRRSFAAGRILLKKALSYFVPDVPPRSWRIAPDAMGAISISKEQNPSGLFINLSRRRHRVACAVSTRAVGVDIEEISRDVDIEGVSRTVFTSDELDTMSTLDSEGRRRFFFERWCLKEAYVKALGVGFHLEPNRFQIVADSQSTLRVASLGVSVSSPSDRAHRFRFSLLDPDPEHLLAVAHEVEDGEELGVRMGDCSALGFLR